MKTILCFGDSNTWGYSPKSQPNKTVRFSFNTRWTGQLQDLLGADYRIIEEGLSGRTTVFDDPLLPEGNGRKALSLCLKTHQPIDYLILMLGTNDTKSIFSASDIDILRGVESLIQLALNPYVYAGYKVPQIILAAPAPLKLEVAVDPESHFTKRSVELSNKLGVMYKELCLTYNCKFLDLAEVTQVSDDDYVHLNENGHIQVAKALKNIITE